MENLPNPASPVVVADADNPQELDANGPEVGAEEVVVEQPQEGPQEDLGQADLADANNPAEGKIHRFNSKYKSI